METATTIIFSILFLALWGHILFELFFKKKFKSYNVDDFHQIRITDGKTQDSSDSENDEALGLLNEVYMSWPVVEETEDDEFHAPLKSKQIKESTILLNAVIALAPTHEDVVNRLNELTDVTNQANKRVFNGSKTLIIVALVMFVLISLISGSWSGAVFFIGSIIFYILASFTPTFVINKKILNGQAGKSSFMTSLIGGLFGSVATARTIHLVDKSTGQIVDTDNSETWISLIFTFIILFFVSFFIFFIGLVNYIRNYWINI